jgi:predicted site-specific integrase-resolvase
MKYTPEWLTMLQASEILGVHRVTLWEWVRDGKVPADCVSKKGNRNQVRASWVRHKAAA